jgi:hypothetical protein
MISTSPNRGSDWRTSQGRRKTLLRLGKTAFALVAVATTVGWSGSTIDRSLVKVRLEETSKSADERSTTESNAKKESDESKSSTSAKLDQTAAADRGEETAANEKPSDVRRVAAKSPKSNARTLDLTPRRGDRTDDSLKSAEPSAVALAAIADCKTRYENVHDYVCTFIKVERHRGKLLAPHVIAMKVRTKPNSVYLRFIKPKAGREAIHVEGRNGGKVLAHDVGLGKLIAGTLSLDPRGEMAMEDSRHPITDAGIGPMINMLEAHWKVELKPGVSEVSINEHMKVGDRPCKMITTRHVEKQKGMDFYLVRVFIDRELGLPIRFEGYDWPKRAGLDGELIEEYTYKNLKLNVGLSEIDFDARNKNYAFGRL